MASHHSPRCRWFDLVQIDRIRAGLSGSDRLESIEEYIEQVEDFMLVFESLFDDHLDDFCMLDRGRSRAPSPAYLRSVLARNIGAFQALLCLSMARLLESTLVPHALYPGRMCERLVEGLLFEAHSWVTAALRERVMQAEPDAWQRGKAALTEFARESRGWTTWPSIATCEQVIAAAASIEPSWAQAVVELQHALRSAGRWRGPDHTFRRAARHWSLLLEIVQTIAAPRGGLRLWFEYINQICAQFCGEGPDDSDGRGGYDLFVLEVLSFVTQIWRKPAHADLRLPPALEQGRASRRQRLQRARLRLFSAWQPGPPEEWINSILPMLERLAHCEVDS